MVTNRVDRAAARVDNDPSEAQKDAGNYQKGHTHVHGLPITIETPRGASRSGIGKGGRRWSVRSPEHYGYIKKTTGADGDHVDAYVGPHHTSRHVTLVDQVDPDTRKFDEHKALLGFADGGSALDAYHNGFSDSRGPDRVGAATHMDIDAFKGWLEKGNTKKPHGRLTKFKRKPHFEDGGTVTDAIKKRSKEYDRLPGGLRTGWDPADGPAVRNLLPEADKHNDTRARTHPGEGVPVAEYSHGGLLQLLGYGGEVEDDDYTPLSSTPEPARQPVEPAPPRQDFSQPVTGYEDPLPIPTRQRVQEQETSNQSSDPEWDQIRSFLGADDKPDIKPDAETGTQQDEPSTLGALGRTFLRSAGSAVAALPEIVAGAAIGQATIPIPVVGGLIGGIAGGYLASKTLVPAKEWASDMVGLDSPESRAADVEKNKEHPNLALGAEVAGAVPTLFGPGSLGTTIAQRLTNRAIMGGGAGAMDAGSQALNKDEVDWKEVAANTAAGALFAKPNRFGKPVVALGERMGAPIAERVRAGDAPQGSPEAAAEVHEATDGTSPPLKQGLGTAPVDPPPTQNRASDEATISVVGDQGNKGRWAKLRQDAGVGQGQVSRSPIVDDIATALKAFTTDTSGEVSLPKQVPDLTARIQAISKGARSPAEPLAPGEEAGSGLPPEQGLGRGVDKTPTFGRRVQPTEGAGNSNVNLPGVPEVKSAGPEPLQGQLDLKQEPRQMELPLTPEAPQRPLPTDARIGQLELPFEAKQGEMDLRPPEVPPTPKGIVPPEAAPKSEFGQRPALAQAPTDTPEGRRQAAEAVMGPPNHFSLDNLRQLLGEEVAPRAAPSTPEGLPAQPSGGGVTPPGPPNLPPEPPGSNATPGRTPGGLARDVTNEALSREGGMDFVATDPRRLTPEQKISRSFDDFMYASENRQIMRNYDYQRWSQGLIKKYGLKDADLEQIHDAWNDPGALPQKLRDAYSEIKGVKDEAGQIREAVRKTNPKYVSQDLDVPHLHRIAKGYNPLIDALKSDDVILETRKNKDIFYAPKEKERTFMALEGPNGERQVISPHEDLGFTKWTKYDSVYHGDKSFKAKYGETYKDSEGKTWKVTDPTMKEVEANALNRNNKPMEYHRNPLASVVLEHARISQAQDALHTVDALKKDATWNSVATRPGQKPREGYEEITGVPLLRGWHVHPEMADVIQKFKQSGFDVKGLEGFRHVTRLITRSLFINPIPHLANKLVHSVEYNLGSQIQNPSMKRWYRSGQGAIREFLSPGELTHEIMEAGGSLMYPRLVAGEGPVANLFKAHIDNNLPEWANIAKTLGAHPVEFIKALYNASGKVMWAGGDMMYMQAVIDAKMRGLSTKDAINAVNKVLPTYRVPTKMFGSQAISKLTTEPALMAFGRYHWAVMNAWANIAKKVVGDGANNQTRLEALGNVMGLGLMAFAIYPILSKGWQVLSGDKNAEQRWRGPLSVPGKMLDFYHGKDNQGASAPLTELFMPAKGASMIAELRGNEDWRGKHIYEPGHLRDAMHGNVGSGVKLLGQVGSYLARNSIAPIGQASQDAAAGKSVGQSLLHQLGDFKTPSKGSQKYRAQAASKARQEAQTRERKTKDPIEKVFNWLGNQ